MDIKKLTWVLPIVATSFSVSALAQGDTRSIGMGGTGVASANYLTSSFHNPARAARYGENDSFGMILPTIGVSAQNVESFMDKVDYYNDTEDELSQDPTNSELQERWKAALQDLGNEKLNAQATVGFAFAIPNKYVSTNLFANAQVSSIAIGNVDQRDLDNLTADYSTIDTLLGGHVDVGLTFAKSFELADHSFSVGISPKFQHLVSFAESSGIEEFEDLEVELTEKSAFNIDLGVNYQVMTGLDVGLVAKNLISNELTSEGNSDLATTYQVEPEYKMAVAYSTHLYTVALDIDLNSRQYFKEYENDLQFTSIGGEFNAWDWAQLRVGYKYSMTDYSDSLITAGIGLKPFGMFGLDIAGQFGEDDDYGVSAQIIIHI